MFKGIYVKKIAFQIKKYEMIVLQINCLFIHFHQLIHFFYIYD